MPNLGSAQSRLHALDDDYYVHGALPQSRYRSVKAKLEREIDRLRQLVDDATKQRVVLHADPRAYWASADIVQRRELVRLLVQRVTIVPARRGMPRFDPSRVDIELRLEIRPGLAASPGDRRGALTAGGEAEVINILGNGPRDQRVSAT